MPKGKKLDEPSVLCTMRIYESDLEKLRQYYPSGYNNPVRLLIRQHTTDLDKHFKKELERLGFSSGEIAAVVSEMEVQ